MNVFSKENMIPLMSLLAGILVACGFFQWKEQTDPAMEAAVERFDDLTESEQTNVRNIAGAHLKNPSYSARMEAIHEEVQKDPALLPKLTALNELLRKQDRRVQSKLQPEGKFAEDWVQQVTELHRRDVATPDVIEIRLGFGMDDSSPVAQISEDQVEAFLTAALPDPLPEELQNKLGDLNKSDQTLERECTKMIWVLRNLFPAPVPGKPFGPESMEGWPRITDAMVAHLFDRAVVDQIGERLVERKPEMAGDPERRLRAVTMAVFASMFGHYESLFNKKHGPGDIVKSKYFQSELDAERRIDLMKVDPADALRRLTGKIIEERNAANPHIEGLSQDIEKMRIIFERMRRIWGSGPRRGDRGDRGGSGRGGYGGGRSGSQGPQGPRRPDGGDRLPEDRPPGSDRRRPGDNGPPGNESPGGNRRRPPEDR